MSNNKVTRPLIYFRVAVLAKEKTHWTTAQISKRFKISTEQAKAVKRKAIALCVMSGDVDRYNRNEILIPNYRP